MRFTRSIALLFSLLFGAYSSVSAYEATYYADSFEGKGTAFGDTFRQSEFSAALCGVDLGILAHTSYGGTGLVVKINDRPNCSKYPEILDLSRAGFSLLAPFGQGRIDVDVTPLSLELPRGYRKAYIGSSVFEKLGIAISPNTPNTYIAGETIRLTGRIMDGKKRGIVYLTRAGSEYEYIGELSLKSDGSFESYVILPEAGIYTLALYSGNTYQIPPAISEKLYVLDAPSDTFSFLRYRSDISPFFRTETRGDVFGVRTREDIWSRFTIVQDTRKIEGSGKGFTLLSENSGFRVGPATLFMESYLLSTPFSFDRSARLPDTKQTIIIDRKYPVENTVKAKTRILRKNIIVEFTIPSGRNVRKDWYVTYPDGSVKEFLFGSGKIGTDGYVTRNILHTLTIPTVQSGTYLIEAVDESGIAYFNIPVKMGNVWNILDPVTFEVKQLARKNIKLIRIASLQSLNKLRAAQNLSLLVEDSEYSVIAQKKAEDMAKRKYIGHVDPEGNRIGDLFRKSGISYTAVGENVAGGSIISSETGESPISDIALVDGLELSGSHRYNMLRSDWTKVGIGYATANGKSYYVQVFGK